MNRRTPLYEAHLGLNAKIVPFAGFDMPLSYSGIVQEHKAVREAAGLFDVSHMGELIVEGPDALEQLQRLTTNDLTRLAPGKAQYTLMCNSSGGVVDDLLLYCLDGERFMLVVNAANIGKDFEWIRSHLKGRVTLGDRSDRYALLALQGPSSRKLLQGVTTSDTTGLAGFEFRIAEVAGQPGVLLSATGYTGEQGFELYVNLDAGDPVAIWNALLESGGQDGLRPAGLGARDTLRLEMGYPLYGNDLTDETTPFEAGLGWVVRMQKGDFIGKEALEKQKREGLENRLIGFVMHEERAIPRQGYPICDADGVVIGEVTSGGQSVTLGRGIGMGYIWKRAEEGDPISIQIRNRPAGARVCRPPFIKKQTG